MTDGPWKLSGSHWHKSCQAVYVLSLVSCTHCSRFPHWPSVQGWPWVLQFYMTQKSLNCFGKRQARLEKFGIYLWPNVLPMKVDNRVCCVLLIYLTLLLTHMYWILQQQNASNLLVYSVFSGVPIMNFVKILELALNYWRKGLESSWILQDFGAWTVIVVATFWRLLLITVCDDTCCQLWWLVKPAVCRLESVAICWSHTRVNNGMSMIHMVMLRTT